MYMYIFICFIFLCKVHLFVNLYILSFCRVKELDSSLKVWLFFFRLLDLTLYLFPFYEDSILVKHKILIYVHFENLFFHLVVIGHYLAERYIEESRKNTEIKKCFLLNIKYY